MTLAEPEPQILVVFGASGDLTRRKIIPALYNLAREGLLPERFAVVGYARTSWSDDEFRAQARRDVEEFSRTPLDETVWKPFAESLFYESGAFDEEHGFSDLWKRLADIDDERDIGGARLFYCATPPSAFSLIVERIGERNPRRDARIVIEKPFGRDSRSARELNETLHRVFDEKQIFRIDHYLGKETVQNILVFRFGNSLFERVWNRDAIEHVQITVAESVGMEGRGGYYEEAGALRDIVQNHVMQVLGFLAMEPPRTLEADAIRDETAKVLRALRPFDPAGVVRGQYSEGTVAGKQVAGFCEEEGVTPGSQTETYVAVRAHIDNWRWSGIPFYIRTGKRLERRTTEIVVRFRAVPTSLFESVGIDSLVPDHLAIHVQPDEAISLAFQAKQPGPGFTPQTVRMDFSYGESFKARPAEAYERLLHDAMDGDGTLFTREDAVERAWTIVQPILDAPGQIHAYDAGSWGPSAADELIAPRRWHVH